MTTHAADSVPRPSPPVAEWTSVLGGASVAAGGRPRSLHEGEKAARKRRKRQAKLRCDAERPPKSLERWRILMDIVDEARRVAELVDHKARYALVVMGVLNAGVFLVLSRAHLLSGLAPGLRPWLIGLLVVYGGLLCVFVFHAVDCLRPRQLRDTGLHPTAGPHGPQGILYWETIGAYDLAGYQRAWSTVRMEQLNAELVLVSHHLSRLLGCKYRALRRTSLGRHGALQGIDLPGGPFQRFREPS